MPSVHLQNAMAGHRLTVHRLVVRRARGEGCAGHAGEGCVGHAGEGCVGHAGEGCAGHAQGCAGRAAMDAPGCRVRWR